MAMIADIQQEIVEEFSLFDTWEEKYEYLIDLGKKLPPIDPLFKTEENKIKAASLRFGCILNTGTGMFIFRQIAMP